MPNVQVNSLPISHYAGMIKLPKTGIIKFMNLLIQKWNIVIKLLCDRWTFVTAFFRTIMTRSSTNYRMALVAPTAGDSIREAHS